VEIAMEPAVVNVRDSKNEAGPVLRFPVQDWAGFLAGVRSGEFDRPGS
jgi:hypothetical protein